MQESGEMYLETILILGKRKNSVRAIDVVEEMGFSKASVSRALAKLKADECVVVGNGGLIALTEKGRSIAEKMYSRHLILTEILTSLGIDKDIAEADACKIEHDISEETFEAMKRHLESRKHNA